MAGQMLRPPNELVYEGLINLLYFNISGIREDKLLDYNDNGVLNVTSAVADAVERSFNTAYPSTQATYRTGRIDERRKVILYEHQLLEILLVLAGDDKSQFGQPTLIHRMIQLFQNLEGQQQHSGENVSLYPLKQLAEAAKHLPSKP